MKTISVTNESPVRHSYISNDEVAEKVHQYGYAVVPFLNEKQLADLRKLYDDNHNISKPGFFFSIFNNDWEYRQKVTVVSSQIIRPSLENNFTKQKVGYSGFVVRGPKDEGEFFIHQDPSFVDETQFSPLHVWCPLYDIELDYAPVCVVPSSHTLAYLHRANSIPAPFNAIRDEVRKYLQPITVKAGEAIFLDPRLIHNSLPNKRDISRPVLLIQIFPEEASYETPYLRDGKLELYSLPEDYFVRNPNFYANVDAQPALGTLKSQTDVQFSDITLEQFLAFCQQHQIKSNPLLTENYISATSLTDI